MNINNIIKLVKVYFIENWRKDLLQIFAVVGGLSLFMTLLSPHMESDFLWMFAFIMMSVYPIRLFYNLSKSSNRIHYLTIPASNGEKVVANMFLANVYYVLFVFLAVLIGIGIAYLVFQFSGVETGPFRPFFGRTNMEFMKILSLYTCISVVFFGSIYFKERPLGKIVGTVFGLIFIFLFIVFLTIKANLLSVGMFDKSMFNVDFSWNIVDSDYKWFDLVSRLLTMVFFYALSFLRFKETEA